MALGALAHRRRRGRVLLDRRAAGLTLFGLGLALMVAPLTATVLAAAPDRHAGIASGVNNAVARAGSLLAVAALPLAVGLTGEEYADPVVFDAGLPLGHAGLRGAAGPRRRHLLAVHPAKSCLPTSTPIEAFPSRSLPLFLKISARNFLK